MKASSGQFPHPLSVTCERHHTSVTAQVRCVFKLTVSAVALYRKYSHFWVTYNIKYLRALNYELGNGPLIINYEIYHLYKKKAPLTYGTEPKH